MVLRCLLVGFVLGLLGSLVMSLFTFSFFEADRIAGYQQQIHGIDAIVYSIKVFGLWSYIKSIIFTFLFFFPCVFLGCFIGTVFESRKGSKRNIWGQSKN